jgi:hypothetical protein
MAHFKMLFSESSFTIVNIGGALCCHKFHRKLVEKSPKSLKDNNIYFYIMSFV